MAQRNRAHIERRRADVADLLLRRRTVREISDELDVPKSTIHRDIAAVRAEWRAERLDDVDEYVAEDLERLAAIERALWPQIEQGDLRAVDRELRLMERRARLLGYDAPERKEVTGTGGSPVTVESWVDLVRRASEDECPRKQ